MQPKARCLCWIWLDKPLRPLPVLHTPDTPPGALATVIEDAEYGHVVIDIAVRKPDRD